MQYYYIDIALLVVIFILMIMITKMNNRIKVLTDNTDGNNIEELIKEYYHDINSLKEENNNIMERFDADHNLLSQAFVKRDIIRYNPLDEVGGELSFVLTCLDSNNNGFILNSIYSHNFSQVYIKPIENGFSNINLSYEEMESLKRAINKIL